MYAQNSLEVHSAEMLFNQQLRNVHELLKRHIIFCQGVCSMVRHGQTSHEGLASTPPYEKDGIFVDSESRVKFQG